MDYSRSDEKSLAATAHEVLREISSKTPEVLGAHVQEMCKTLQDEAPDAQKPNDAGAVDNLKACASFASKYPKEIPQDRKFVQAMSNFALYGSPPEAAKYAVSVVWAGTEKKEAFARDLAEKCIKDFKFGEKGFLARLATLSQLMLLAPNEIDDQRSDEILDIAIKQTLTQVRKPSKKPADEYQWSSTVDEEAQAKCWALKILVNRVRSHPDPENLPEVAAPVYTLLSTFVDQQGEITKAKNTPPTHKSRLRLLAARLYLKLCKQRSHDALLTPSGFNALALVAQDPVKEVRAGFLQRLKKYLNQQKLPQRFYTIPFLIAFEPSEELRSDVTTWIKSRAAVFSSAKSLGASTKPNIVMESVFARLLSLLSHHPDYAPEAEDLVDFSRYIVFYLQNVATPDNLSLIYHIAQRVKQCRDAVSPRSTPDASPSEADDRLYHLSDLAQVTVRKFEEMHNWTIQTLPAKIRLPSSLFSEMKSHAEAQRIAEHYYLPDGVEAGVEAVLKAMLRASRPGHHHGKKRKSEGDDAVDGGRDAKKAKSALPIRKAAASSSAPKVKRGAAAAKTPKPKKAARESKESKEAAEVRSAERRRSGRVKEAEKSYAERDSEEDDKEMEMMDMPAADNNAEEGGTDTESELSELESQDGKDGEGSDEGDREVVEQEQEEEQEAETMPKSATARGKKKATVSPTQARGKSSPHTTTTKARATRARAIAV